MTVSLRESRIIDLVYVLHALDHSLQSAFGHSLVHIAETTSLSLILSTPKSPLVKEEAGAQPRAAPGYQVTK